MSWDHPQDHPLAEGWDHPSRPDTPKVPSSRTGTTLRTTWDQGSEGVGTSPPVSVGPGAGTPAQDHPRPAPRSLMTTAADALGRRPCEWCGGPTLSVVDGAPLHRWCHQPPLSPWQPSDRPERGSQSHQFLELDRKDPR